MPIGTIEERLTALEREMAGLKRQLRGADGHETWLEGVAGSFRDDDEFDEILRLGRDIRAADAPKDATPEQP